MPSKSCKNCSHYRFSDNQKFCAKRISEIIDCSVAGVCKNYKDVRPGANKKSVKCAKCQWLNKYGWCQHRQRCFNETERNKPRKCANFETYVKGKKFEFDKIID